jgi:hypothetical protein
MDGGEVCSDKPVGLQQIL